MKIIVPRHEVEITELIDLEAGRGTQVEIQHETGVPGCFKLYIHEMGKTVLRICKLPAAAVQWPRARTVDEAVKTGREMRERFVDFHRLEQQFKDATAPLPQYKQKAVWNYINALKNELMRVQKDNDEMGEELAKRVTGPSL